MKDTEASKLNRRTRRASGITKQNLKIVLFAILLLCCVLVYRLIYIVNVKGNDYARAVLSHQSYQSTVIPARRGNITDRNGNILATSREVYDCILDPGVILSEWYYLEPSVKAIVDYLGYDEAEIKRIIKENPNSHNYVLEQDMDYEKVSAFKKYQNKTKFVEGVFFKIRYVRTYPQGSLASHVIGFTQQGTEEEGAYGIEKVYEESLTGIEGLEYGYFDSELNKKNVVKDSVDGNTVVSTIDVNIEAILEREVANFLAETGCKDIGVIAMDPNSGEILGMASNYEFDLNDPKNLNRIYSDEKLAEMTEEEKMNAVYKMWRNFCVSDSYEPGSTYKTITVASALEENVVKPKDMFYCGGATIIDRWRISCNNKYGHGDIDLYQSLMKSCNCALIEVAARLGSTQFFKYQNNFGFGRKTGIDLNGEASGIVISENNLNQTELATSSFGTTFNTTMIQIASAYASIINGGTYYRPHVVKEIVNSEGVRVQSFEDLSVRQTVSSSTSQFIKDALYMTVEAGTAKPARVEGYQIAGKTGTAQKHIAKKYDENGVEIEQDKKYTVSFCGFAPYENPQILIYVVIDEIYDREIAGSSSPATKMTSRIMKDVLPYLGLYPEGDIDYHVDESYLNNATDEFDESNPDVLPEGLQ